jgi:uncharacterized membrane protein YedE/YeeE
MENFTPVSAAMGGLMIGLSAIILLALLGQVAGISGIITGLLRAKPGDSLWRALFLGGLIAGTFIYTLVSRNETPINLNPFALSEVAHLAMLISAGLLIGFGSYIGSGCTSGHGICGLARFSIRSISATLTFMLTAVLTVLVVRLVIGAEH